MLSRALADVRQALVAVRRRPTALGVPVLTMAIAIGASTAIFSALYAALFHPLPYPDADRLVMGRATFSGEVNPWASAPDFYDYRERSSVFASLSAYRPQAGRVTIRQGDGGQTLLLTQVSWDFFGTLRAAPALGRLFRSEEGERGGAPVAIISDGYWRRAFGGAKDVLGRTIPLNLGPSVGSVTVIGVMPSAFRFAYDADVWVPMQKNAQGNDVRRFHSWMLLGRLKPGVRLLDAQRQMDAISSVLEKEYPDSNRNKALLLTDLQAALAEDDRPSLLILMAAVGVLLLVACADVAGLLLSRGAARQAEMAIRSALGASPGRLGTQLLAESLLLALPAGVLGVVLAFWLRVLVLRFVPLSSLGVSTLPMGAPVLAFGAALTMLTSVLVGTVPAWFGARANLSTAISGGTRTTETPSRALFRQGLVALQVALAVVLLVAAALLGRSLLRLRAVDPGFAVENLVSAQLQLTGDSYKEPSARVRFYDALLRDIRGLPGVKNANITNNVPIQHPAGNIPVWDPAHPPAQASEAPIACVRFVFPGYLATLGIPLLAGRDLSADDLAAPDIGAQPPGRPGVISQRPRVMVISRSLGRRLFPAVNPVGKRIAIFTGENEPVLAEVVGVAGDARMNSLRDEYSLAMYAPYPASPSPMMRLVVRSAVPPAAIVPALRAAVARRDRGLLLNEVTTMEEVVERSIERFRLRAGAVVLFGGATLLLAMLGVYGVLAFSVNMRRREIGVRVVVGASRPHLVGWVMMRGMLPVILGVVAGLAGAFGVARALRGQLFDVPPADPVTFMAVTVSLAGAALAACLLPAWRATRVDPIVALRAE